MRTASHLGLRWCWRCKINAPFWNSTHFRPIWSNFLQSLTIGCSVVGVYIDVVLCKGEEGSIRPFSRAMLLTINALQKITLTWFCLVWCHAASDFALHYKIATTSNYFAQISTRFAHEKRLNVPMLKPVRYLFATMWRMICRIAVVITTLRGSLWFVAQVTWYSSKLWPEPQTMLRTLFIYTMPTTEAPQKTFFFFLAWPDPPSTHHHRNHVTQTHVNR